MNKTLGWFAAPAWHSMNSKAILKTLIIYLRPHFFLYITLCSESEPHVRKGKRHTFNVKWKINDIICSLSIESQTTQQLLYHLHSAFISGNRVIASPNDAAPTFTIAFLTPHSGVQFILFIVSKLAAFCNKMKDLTVFVFLSLKLEQRLLKTAKEKMEQLSRALSESEFKALPRCQSLLCTQTCLNLVLWC